MSKIVQVSFFNFSQRKFFIQVDLRSKSHGLLLVKDTVCLGLTCIYIYIYIYVLSDPENCYSFGVGALLMKSGLFSAVLLLLKCMVC